MIYYKFCCKGTAFFLYMQIFDDKNGLCLHNLTFSGNNWVFAH